MVNRKTGKIKRIDFGSAEVLDGLDKNQELHRTLQEATLFR
jgi:hypothetical protein